MMIDSGEKPKGLVQPISGVFHVDYISQCKKRLVILLELSTSLRTDSSHTSMPISSFRSRRET